MERYRLPPESALCSSTPKFAESPAEPAAERPAARAMEVLSRMWLLRTYSPGKFILDHTWKLRPVEVATKAAAQKGQDALTPNAWFRE
jgi:hypothetical protein